jgi:hypothetical protein
MLVNHPIEPRKTKKIQKIFALINTIQIQELCSSDEESDTASRNKTAMVCKLAQIPSEIRRTLPLEAKKCLLNLTE